LGREAAAWRRVTDDQAFLAALLHRLPRDVLRRVRLLVRPDTVLRWHRDLYPLLAELAFQHRDLVAQGEYLDVLVSIAHR
jgi:hypothetical protein